MNQWFQTSDGTELAYNVVGDGPLIILCDGVGCDHYVWPYLRTYLAKQFKVVQWNYRGHGESERPQDPGSLRIENHAEDLRYLLSELGETSAILFGHSMGVQVILEFCGRYPNETRALVPVCGSFQYPLDTFMGSQQFKLNVFPHLFRLMTEEHEGFARLWRQTFPSNLAWRLACLVELNGRLVRREDFQPYLEHMAQLDIDLFARTLKAASEHSAELYLEQIETPTLVFAAEKDGFTPPAVSETMAEKIPGAQLCVVPGASHSAPIEVPELFALRVEKFFLDHDLYTD